VPASTPWSWRRVNKAHLTMRPFPHQPDLTALFSCPFGHQVSEFGVVAELSLLDGGHREDGHLPQLAEKVIQEVQRIWVRCMQVID
jgi:hypothetical protein